MYSCDLRTIAWNSSRVVLLVAAAGGGGGVIGKGGSWFGFASFAAMSEMVFVARW